MPGRIKEFKVVCRGSLLSRAQAQYFIDKIRTVDPNSHFDIVVKDTAGDRDQQMLLQDMDGKDFFTKDIQDFLVAGHADFAVHSLKDVSSEQFFKNNSYAVISREDPHDVAIFNQDVPDKISSGVELKLGTSSPRRALMATRFLEKALPTVNNHRPKIAPLAIRGNVDTRLQKLDSGQYDGIILAVAGLNRLLAFPAAVEVVSRLLHGKKLMVLPLIDCPPAPGQGVIVSEALTSNHDARRLLDRINDVALLDFTRRERAMAAIYGAGCHQQFGVVHISTPHIAFTYGSGIGNNSQSFEKYDPHPDINSRGGKIFSAGDHMKSLFRYEYPKTPVFLPDSAGLFVGSQHAVQDDVHIAKAAQRRIWTAGTKTWFELAKKGLWVEGCADAMGLEFIEPWLGGPLIGLNRSNLTILTDSESASEWRKGGWNAIGTYSVSVEGSNDVVEAISSADIVFWTSFRQYTRYKDTVKSGVTHCCSTGKTADRFKELGINPVVFAGIKGFNAWRDTVIKDA